MGMLKSIGLPLALCVGMNITLSFSRRSSLLEMHTVDFRRPWPCASGFNLADPEAALAKQAVAMLALASY